MLFAFGGKFCNSGGTSDGLAINLCVLAEQSEHKEDLAKQPLNDCNEEGVKSRCAIAPQVVHKATL